MTTRGQNLRSSTPGNKPANNTRQPGELWITFPDRQLGYIDASRTAQPAIAVRFFSTLANYAIGDYVVQAGQLYRARVAVNAGAFNAGQWTLTGGSVLVAATAPPNPTPGDMWFDSTGGQLYIFYNDGDSSQWVVAVNQNIAGGVYLPLGGGAMTGAIVNGTVDKAPTAPLGIVNKGYADASDAALAAAIAALPAIGDNRIINGDMRIDQRNNGASVTPTASTYCIDRWKASVNVASKLAYQTRVTTPFAFNLSGHAYALNITTQATYTAAAGDMFQLFQPIEADMVSDFQWGTANAQAVTLSFWVASNGFSGAFSGAISDPSGSRSYPFTFPITAGAWTKCVVNIPGDQTTSWLALMQGGNAAAVLVHFDLGSGSNLRGPANAWASANCVGATGADSLVGKTNGSIFYLTGVKLEIGSVATPFNRQSLAKSLIDCQRYFQLGQLFLIGQAGAAGQNIGYGYAAPVMLRGGYAVGSPLALNITANGSANWTPASASYNSNNMFSTQGAAVAAGPFTINLNYSANAEL